MTLIETKKYLDYGQTPNCYGSYNNENVLCKKFCAVRLICSMNRKKAETEIFDEILNYHTRIGLVQ